MVEFRFSDLVAELADIPDTRDRWLVEIEANLRVMSDECEVLNDPYMAILELLEDLVAWRDSDMEEGKGLFWTPRYGTEDQGILAFSRAEGGWQLSSCWGSTSTSVHSDREMSDAIDALRESVLAEIESVFGPRLKIPVE